MTLDEIRKAKAALEDDLRIMIGSRVSAFNNATGCAITGLRMDLFNARTLGDPVPITAVTGVSVAVDTGL
ncbi:hypothetical protein J7E62_27615 [Variovorax paradoxus]|nr:hypothetical protein [Variovorax paradoxus]